MERFGFQILHYRQTATHYVTFYEKQRLQRIFSRK